MANIGKQGQTCLKLMQRDEIDKPSYLAHRKRAKYCNNGVLLRLVCNAITEFQFSVPYCTLITEKYKPDHITEMCYK